MNALRFTAYGVAQPKGSTKSFGYIAKDKATGAIRFNKHGKPMILTTTTSDNEKNKTWQELVGTAAMVAIAESSPRFHLIEYAAEISLTFYLPRPKAIRDKRIPHTKKPDLDKLVRSALDAMTAVVFADDALITKITTTKYYAEPGDAPRCDISVAEIHSDGLFSSAEPNLLANGGLL